MFTLCTLRNAKFIDDLLTKILFTLNYGRLGIIFLKHTKNSEAPLQLIAPKTLTVALLFVFSGFGNKDWVPGILH